MISVAKLKSINFVQLTNTLSQVMNFQPHEPQCCLTLDEMRLKSGFDYDPSSGQVLGSVTLDGYGGPAQNALVFIIGGKWRKTLPVFTCITQRYLPGVLSVCNFYPLL